MERLGKIALVILLLTLMAHGAESDLPDPTRNKSLEQETVEKYFNAFLKRDFNLAVSYTHGVDKPEIRARRIANYKKFFKEGEEALVKMYEKDYKGEYLSSAYESETLITFRRGENRDGNPVILAMYTERHLVKVAGNEKPWQLFWHVEYFVTLKGGKIVEVKLDKTELLMILKK